MDLLLAKPEKLHLGSLLVRKNQSKIFPNKILLDQFLAYMLLQLYAKNRVNYEGQFFIKLKKPHFGPILALVAKKQEKFFSQKSFRSTLKVYNFSANSWKQKNSTDFSQNLKNIILVPLWALFSPNTSEHRKTRLCQFLKSTRPKRCVEYKKTTSCSREKLRTNRPTHGGYFMDLSLHGSNKALLKSVFIILRNIFLK